MSNLESNAL
jgi:exoribonuclease R